MKTFAAFFASGLVITFKAFGEALANAHAHKYAVNNTEYLEVVVEVYDVEYLPEVA
jgi:hypothetical protein